jgi:hypothetical protein
MINAYINHTGAKGSILLPTPASNLVKSLHVGICGTCESQVSWIPVLLVVSLALSNCETLGKGALRTYPPSMVPSHLFRQGLMWPSS